MWFFSNDHWTERKTCSPRDENTCGRMENLAKHPIYLDQYFRTLSLPNYLWRDLEGRRQFISGTIYIYIGQDAVVRLGISVVASPEKKKISSFWPDLTIRASFRFSFCKNRHRTETLLYWRDSSIRACPHRP